MGKPDFSDKNKIRQQIVDKRKFYTPAQLQTMSDEVMEVVELSGAFQDAKNIFLYYGCNREVETKRFIDKWANEKNFYLPVVVGDDMVLRKYSAQTTFKMSNFGILEPEGEDFTDYKKLNLAIVPGLAFDRKMNRLGYGKGYYDRFFKSVNVSKLGVCFDFQLFDNLPSENHDVKMDVLISENELIW